MKTQLGLRPAPEERLRIGGNNTDLLEALAELISTGSSLDSLADALDFRGIVAETAATYLRAKGWTPTSERHQKIWDMAFGARVDCVTTKNEGPQNLDGVLELMRQGAFFEARSILNRFLLSDSASDQLRVHDFHALASIGAEAVSFFDTECRSAEQLIRRRTNQKIGRLLERYSATSARLFAYREPILHQVSAINSGDVFASIRVSHGIVGHVAETKLGYCAPNTGVDPKYLSFGRNSVSEIAVPIFDTTGSNILGVFSLESRNPNTFSRSQIQDLLADAATFSADLLRLSNLSSRDPAGAAWAVGLSTWKLSDAIERFCLHMAEVFEKYLRVRPTCTIWNFDKSKRRCWAIATAGFDFEYTSWRTLSEDCFTAKVARAPRESVFRKDSKEFETHFKRKCKAESMGLKGVVSVPVYLNNDQEIDGASCVLSFYFFDTPPVIPDYLVLQLARIIGQYISEFTSALKGLLGNYVGEMFRDHRGLSPESGFDTLRTICLSILDAQACSIFVPDGSDSIVCISSNGLEANGVQLRDISQARYSLASEEDRYCVTGFLATNPGLPIRKLDIPNPEESWDSMGRVKPMRRYRDATSPSESDHRSFLGIGVAGGDGEKSIGVIRILRAVGKPHFTSWDEIMISTIAERSQAVFERWMANTRLSGFVTQEVNRILGLLSKAGRTPSSIVAEACRRILTPFVPMAAQRTHLIDEFLQHLLRVFPGGIHCVLWELLPSVDNSTDLRLAHFHSTVRKESPIQEDIQQIKISDGNIEVSCLQQSTIASVVSRGSEHFQLLCVNSDAHRVQAAVCVPLKSFSQYGCSEWVLVLGLGAVHEWTADEIEVLLHLTRKLAAIIGDGKGPLFQSPLIMLDDLLSICSEILNPDWSSVEIEHGLIGKFELRRGEAEFDYIPDAWNSLSGDMGRFGARFLKAGGKTIKQFPLRYSAFDVGWLTVGGNGRLSNLDQHRWNILLESVHRTWVSYSEFPGAQTGLCSWWGDIRSHETDTNTAVSRWTARPKWLCDPDKTSIHGGGFENFK